jgi:hypothetical protein
MMITITTGATPLPLSVGCQELGSGARSGEKLRLLRFSDHEVRRCGVLESGRLPDRSGVRHRLRPVHQLGETVGRPPVAVERHSVAVRVLLAVTWRGPTSEIGGRPDSSGQHELGERGSIARSTGVGREFGAS